ncbi:hypothetical protein SMACR_01040 [Sordaria macrospora]|uniref:ATPase synthesis protein 25, mitochondrial n=2 Tax=Sordaria macrospora TaxID=5147 RepID=ATP25_SORMK|nr:uncharacterized protein SMAC_01040 [Sordaria macrospora k-hell]D1ZCP6.1 RecName: Full=ATPase synthesis protein 25, mitochondrial; Flags: Precursor [Sordaria macrospora k-hell]KAA8632771.1 hypothetical protein SMACR_01040 [Sordaria macrospora]KAH7630586.1 hypothetical protein B0T09DRAFT_338058 [Sordaria sp. MPI-SDFR-AT-0083]WPJ62282.1 hypothetical protein SMAC4_01040 [Sordaria macrospora]CCC07017.1 unnamed protein product [Sordaria macrospora k-hell]
MSATPAVLRASACSACRFSALRLFVSSFATPRAPLPAARTRILSPAVTYSTFRPSPRLLASPAIEEHAEPAAQEQPNKIEDAQAEANKAEASTETSNEGGADVPWYLQVDAPTHPTLVHEPPPLPDIPEGSPKLMEPLVKFVSDELGMDNLDLLDLRAIDPPPALGPEVLMLFGTARSERHLHVSADRLVRWLRNRGISAKADGLLGRNELKTKLRRKARKAKLLGTTGLPSGADDGITTGWICVNLGTIGWSDMEMEFKDENGMTSGFGVPQSGTTIVVQLMTETRREELALEKLWSGILRRSLERQDKIDGKLPDATFTTAPDTVSRSTFLRPTPIRSSGRNRKRPDRLYFSTSARQHAKAVDVSQTDLATAMAGWEYSNASPSTIDNLLAQDTDSKVQLLFQMQDYLYSLPKDQALSAVSLCEDGSPSTFMRLFNRAIENLPSAQAWEARLWLEKAARALQHPDHGLARLGDLIQEMKLSGAADLSREKFVDFLRMIFAIPETTDAGVRQQASLSMDVIDMLFSRGEKVIEFDVVVAVIESLLRTGVRTPEARRLLTQFEDLLGEAQMDCPTEDEIIRLLDVYAHYRAWEKFWNVWRIFPRYCERRTERMYTKVYERIAAVDHQAMATDALRWCVEEMWHEQPPVRVTPAMLKALEACIRIADPEAESLAKDIDDRISDAQYMDREFVRLWLTLHGSAAWGA